MINPKRSSSGGGGYVVFRARVHASHYNLRFFHVTAQMGRMRKKS